MSQLKLRARQRRDTLRRLHEAAVELVRDGDLGSATVDLIAERAGVSRRTFFNYYATKEDAILGATEPAIPDAALREFNDEASGGDPFTRIVGLVGAIVRSTREVDGMNAAERRRLLTQYPELRVRLQHHLNAAEGLAEALLTEHFSARKRGATAADDARAHLILAGAVLRLAYSRNPDVLDAPNSAATDWAIATFKEALADAT